MLLHLLATLYGLAFLPVVTDYTFTFAQPHRLIYSVTDAVDSGTAVPEHGYVTLPTDSPRGSQFRLVRCPCSRL